MITQLNSELSDGINIRYNAESDSIELLINGIWTFWRAANTRRKYLIQNGKLLGITFSNMSRLTFGNGYIDFNAGYRQISTVFNSEGFDHYTVITQSYGPSVANRSKTGINNTSSGNDVITGEINSFGFDGKANSTFNVYPSENYTIRITDVYME